jgi:acetyl esterase/lipase
MIKRLIVAVCCAFSFACVSSRAGATAWEPSGHAQSPIWPGKVPDAQRPVGPEDARRGSDLIAGRPIAIVDKVSLPTMTVYSPKGKNTGAAVVVFPGGGYQILAIDLEGTEVADWLNSKGITCVLLKYRVPGDGQKPRSGAYPDSPVALEDAQRTVGLVRFHAKDWNINPHKIGVLGFSAGGHLVAAISTNYNKRLYKEIDSADKVSCRPDFAVAGYPGHMREHTSKPFHLNPFVPVTKETPPTFLFQAENDPVDDVENSLVYFDALKKAGVPAELHIYAEGKHGFGLRRTELPITGWPELVETWFHTIGILSN